MLKHHINHITAEENNHHILGIINRFIKTIRDLNQERDITDESMKDIISEYKSSKHSTIKKSPNSFNRTDEFNWMSKKINETESKYKTRIPEGSMVKILNEGKFQKKRSNYSSNEYKINSRDGNQYIVEAKDKNVGRYPGYKHMETQSRTLMAKTLNDDRYGIVEEITDFNFKKNKYKLIYEGAVRDEVAPKILRKGNPARLSIAEVNYWNKIGGKDKLPKDMRRLV
jgi:hypothetical protein